MSEIIIKGKTPACIQREEIKAVVLATITVMANHNYYLHRPGDLVEVRLVPDIKKLGTNSLTGGKNGGLAWRKRGVFWIWSRKANTKRAKSNFTTVLIHETIHLCNSWADSDEHIVSTLTDRLKPTIIKIAEALVVNTHPNRAHFAHCKPGMSYHRSEEDDCYNDEQWGRKITTSNTSAKERWRLYEKAKQKRLKRMKERMQKI